MDQGRDSHRSCRAPAPRWNSESVRPHLVVSALHDARDAGRIVAVTLIDLHLEYRPGMARVDTDHRQSLDLIPGSGQTATRVPSTNRR
jgi:hypothetical protein